MAMAKVRFVCVSDTHNAAPGEGFTLPKGDVLVHAGDLTNQGSLAEVRKAITWIEKADFATKLVVAGNHDLSLDPQYGLKYQEGWNVLPAEDSREACRALVTSSASITYLQHSTAVVHVPSKQVSFTVFGSPYSPDRGGQNWAFQYGEDAASSLWNDIRTDTDVVITHTPPAGHCDASEHWKTGGCRSLNTALSRVRPLMHICGHCHEGRGAKVVQWNDETGTANDMHTWIDPGLGSKKQSLFDLTGMRSGHALRRGEETAVVNASITAQSYGRGAKEFNKPIVVDLLMPIQ